MKYLSLAIQKYFFKGLQVSPRPSWVNRATKLGEIQRFDLNRNGGRIRCALISPRSDVDQNLVDTIVIFSHPITRQAKYFFTETNRARAYLDRGHSVFLFDYNGFGESDCIDLFYWRDVEAVIDYVKNLYPGRRIILHGVSFGAFHILRSMESLPPDSRVIIENVNKSLLSYWKRWPITCASIILLQCLRVRSVREMDVQATVKKLNRDDLDIRFLACESDDTTTVEEMRELYLQLASAKKKFFVFLGARHLAAQKEDPKLYASALFGEG